MLFLIGPCMFVAPLLVVLLPVAVVLWLPTLALLGIAWLLWWPVAAAAGGAARAAHCTLGRWFRTVLTPWTYFDIPNPSTAAPPSDDHGKSA